MADPPPITNIWQDCLRSFDVGANADDEDAQASNEAFPVLFFGDVEAGKWSLVNGLRKPETKGSEGGKKKLPGVPLGYTFVSVKEEDGPSDGFNLHSWVIDQPANVERFMPLALASSVGAVSAPPPIVAEDEDDTEPQPEPESTESPPVAENMADLAPAMERAVGVICLDLARPWTAANSLAKWIQTVSDAVEAFAKQVEATDYDAAQRLRSSLKERVRSAKYAGPQTTQGGGDTAAPSPAKSAVERKAGDSMADDGYAGIPLIVVACKSDEIDNWHSSMSFEDNHADYIKAHLRKACLGAGASLIYTSTKQNINVDKLRDYLLHRLVQGRPCTADLGDGMDQTAIFVPAGIDTQKKIDTLLEGVFGSNHPEQQSALTSKTTMYARIEECINNKVVELKEASRKDLVSESGCTVSLGAVKEGLELWLASYVDESKPKSELHDVLAKGLATKPEAVADMGDATEVNLNSFNEKLRSHAADKFSWVILDPNARAAPSMEPLKIDLDQEFLKKVSETAPTAEISAPRVTGSRPTSSRTKSSRAPAPTASGGDGQQLREQAGDFFAGLVNSSSSKSKVPRGSKKGAAGKAAGKGGKPSADMFAKLAKKK